MHGFPALDHLVALTDDVGLFQHATLDVPNRSCGYCTDDVGRALVVACDAATRDETAEIGTRLLTTYLSYLHDAQLPDGWFHGFMGYDRRWQDDAASPDAVGRAIWGLGYAERFAPRPTWRALAGRLGSAALPAISRMEFVRARAYAILGLIHRLAAEPVDASAVRATLDESAGILLEAYERHRGPGWQWCEDLMTYDNARIPEALLRVGTALSNERYVRAGLAMLEFYAGVVIEDGKFVPVGNAGWYPRGGEKSRTGQQPLEAAAMVDAACAALAVTGNQRWRHVAEIANAWFHGGNTHGVCLPCEAGGCADGIDEVATNPNMGAESTVAYLMSSIAMARLSPAEALRLAR